MTAEIKKIFIVIFLFFFIYNVDVQSQEIHKSESLKHAIGYPIKLDSDTLFYIYGSLGTFSAEKRAEEITIKVEELYKNDHAVFDSIKIMSQFGMPTLVYNSNVIMGITQDDAAVIGKNPTQLANTYKDLLINKLKQTRELYSQKSLIKNGLYTLLYFLLLIVLFWTIHKTFPWLYSKTKTLEGKLLRPINIKGKEVIKSFSLVSFVIILLQGIRLAITLYAVYIFIVTVVEQWPYTRNWEIQPILKGIILFIFYSVVLISMGKGVNALVAYLINKYQDWKDKIIKSVRIKSVELLSAKRTVELLEFGTKILRFALLLVLFYSYLTIIFSLFDFSKTWAEKLLTYITQPLSSVFNSIINFLPNLFFIVVLVFVFQYLIRFIKFIFGEIERGNLVLSGFHDDWAMPTYKIVRFLVLILAAIIIFPYLPGSSSPFFQGISVFVGILLSLGSSSAISNMVAGVVLTYMRPFKLNDRVKIADTVGDVIEKTLLVTRIRTIKNVDITIPNSMVLGSHIINYSSSLSEKGLILHTTVTIGYDVPWKKIHELLISAALETDNLKSDPAPFVLQTSLDDFYVSYEINAYTDKPGIMAAIYSKLHSKIQDKFNDAGVEIMSPHYGAMRDGNQTAIPDEYLPKEYKAPSFRVFGVNIFGNKNENK